MKMKIDKNVFLNEYIEETKENLDVLLDSVGEYEKDHDNNEVLELLLRTLHTLKGTSRMMGYHKVEEITHGLEDIFKKIQTKQIILTKKIVELTKSVAKKIYEYVVSLENNKETEFSLYEEIIKNVKNAIDGNDFSCDFIVENEQLSEINSDTNKSDFSEVKSIRIGLSSVDNIIRSYDKLITSEFRLKNNLNILEDLINRNEDVGQQCRTIKEDINMLEQQTFSVQEQIIALRMLPLNMILKTLKRSAEEEAVKLEKNIIFNIPPSEISLDKVILENLPGILIHIVRNSIDHGIETKDERIKLGKPEVGEISVSAKQISNRIIITISDDGRGIDSEKIRNKAIELFPDRKDEILEMNEKYLQQFLFMSGFSTASKESLISGRGVGLDSVRDSMDKLKGKISVRSQKNQGTVFELSLPMSLATQEGLFLSSNETKFLVLSHYVSEIVTEAESDLIQLQHGLFLPLRNELLPIYDCSLIFGINNYSSKKKKKKSIVILEYLEKKIGIMVDQIVNYMTVVVKPLPMVLKNFKAVQGVVFDEDYNIIPLIHVPDLMKRLNALKEYEVKSFEVNNKTPEYYVLVADDSHTTRQIEKMILEAEGYKVSVACDGIDALEMLKKQKFDIVISDIKMPRMDGFVLIENIRRTEMTKDIPIIVISSVFEENTAEKIKEVGAQAYIVKSDFERGNLVAAVKELLDEKNKKLL